MRVRVPYSPAVVCCVKLSRSLTMPSRVLSGSVAAMIPLDRRSVSSCTLTLTDGATGVSLVPWMVTA